MYIQSIASSALEFPKELSGFEDVFSETEAAKLPTFEHGDHAIDISEDLPFGPLYNLSRTELDTLRKYLDDALERG